MSLILSNANMHIFQTHFILGCEGCKLINIKGQIHAQQPDRFPTSCLLLLLNLRHSAFTESHSAQLAKQPLTLTSPAFPVM